MPDITEHPGFQQAALEQSVAEEYIKAMYPSHPHLPHTDEHPLWINSLRVARFFIWMVRTIKAIDAVDGRTP